MTLAIFTHVDHVITQDKIFGYAPYIREMNIWLNYCDKIIVVAPASRKDISKIDLEYKHDSIQFIKIPLFNISAFKEIFKFIILAPKLFWIIFREMKQADHIHLRCPGNVGLLACFVQILFPKKTKTAKYAGNWDPKAKQPWSYKLQKWILNNTFLTKNMQVLVYGEWDNMSKNIKPFFTATYTEQDAIASNKMPLKYLPTTNVEPINFMYVGTLSSGKRPLYALQLFQQVQSKELNCRLDVYGEGMMRESIEKFIKENNLQNKVFLHGNQPKEVVEKAYQQNHFLILASQSEGWPKVVAEAMFWGCVPLSTNVSCVYQMMGFGSRGLLLNLDLNHDGAKILQLIDNVKLYEQMSKNGKEWSTQYTLDKFENEIAKLLN